MDVLAADDFFGTFSMALSRPFTAADLVDAWRALGMMVAKTPAMLAELVGADDLVLDFEIDEGLM